MLECVTESARIESISPVMAPMVLFAFIEHPSSDSTHWLRLLGLFTRGEETVGLNESLIGWLFSRRLYDEFFTHAEVLVSGLSQEAVSRFSALLEPLYADEPLQVTRLWSMLFESTGNYECGHLLWTQLEAGQARLRVGHLLLNAPKTGAALSAEIYIAHADDTQSDSERLKFLEASVRLDPSNDGTFNQLVRLHMNQGHLDRVGRLFDERLERMPGFASSRDFYRHKGRSLQTLGNLLGAERSFRAAVDLGDGFEDRCALGDVLWAQRKLKDYVALEIRTLRLDGDKRSRFELTGSRLESHGDIQSVFRYLAHALQEVVPHESGLQRLLSAMQETSRYWEAVKTLQSMSSKLGGAERTRVLMYAGDIYSQRLNRLDSAAECYRDCLSQQPLFEEARIALVRVLGRQNQPAEMVAEASDLPDAARVSIGRPLVDAFRSVEHHEAANVLLQGCFDLEPSHRANFQDLFTGLRRQGKNAQAVEAAERFLHAGGSCELEMIRELAAMSLNELGSQASALKWLSRIASNALSTQDRLLEIECYFAPASSDLLADWLDVRSATAGGDGTAIVLSKRIADGFAKGDFHASQAVGWLERIVDQVPRSFEALSLILEVAESAQLHETIGRTLLKLLRLPIGAQQETEVLTRLGVLNATVLKSPEQAIGYLERSLKREPSQLEARLMLAEIYLDRDFAKRALALLTEVRQVTMPVQSLEFRYLGLVLRGGTLVKASQVEWAAERLLSLQPDSRQALEILAKRAANEGEWDHAERLVLELLAHHRADMSHADLSNWLYVLGTVHEYKMGYRVASVLYEEALSIDPSNQRASRALRNEDTLLERSTQASDSPGMQSLLDDAEKPGSDSD